MRQGLRKFGPELPNPCLTLAPATWQPAVANPPALIASIKLATEISATGFVRINSTWALFRTIQISFCGADPLHFHSHQFPYDTNAVIAKRVGKTSIPARIRREITSIFSPRADLIAPL